MVRVRDLVLVSSVLTSVALLVSPAGADDNSCSSPSQVSQGSTAGSYFGAVSQAESSNNAASVNKPGFMGLYQMGGPALVQAGYASSANGNFNIQWNGTNGVWSQQDFLNNPAAQNDAFFKYEQGNWAQIKAKGLDRYVGQTINGTTITQSGLLMGSQFGVGNLSKYLNSGGSCSYGIGTIGSNPCTSQWIAKGNGYDVSDITGVKESNVTGNGSSGNGGGGSSGTNTASNSNCQNNQQDNTEMTSQACAKTMPIIEGIDCGRFPAKIQGFCQQYKPYLMTRSGCEEAEKWAKEQVEASGGGGDQNPTPQKPQTPDNSGGGSGGEGSEPFQVPGTVNNGDDGMPDSNGESQMVSPQPSQATGGGPGGTPNNAVTGQPASGGPVPVGKIRAGNWKEACKKQTKHDGASVWSYVLWCSQLKTDPPRRQSGNESSIAGNLGYSGPGTTAGPSGSGVGSSVGGSGGGSGGGSSGGSGSGSSSDYNGTDTKNPTLSSNATQKVSDDKCVQELTAAGVTFTFEGNNVAKKIEPVSGKMCFVKVGVTVKKWATVTMPPVSHMNCSLAIKVNQWVKGLGISRMTHMGSYSCRTMKNGRGPSRHITYHGYGDAFDVAGMDGVTFKGGVRSGIQERARAAACGVFDRVLTDKYYAGAYTHFHVEMNHGHTCR